MEPSFGGTLKEDVTKTFTEYIENAGVRVPEIVYDESIFLTQAYCFIKMGLLELPS